MNFIFLALYILAILNNDDIHVVIIELVDSVYRLYDHVHPVKYTIFFLLCHIATLDIPYIRKIWRCLNLAILPASGPYKILAKF